MNFFMRKIRWRWIFYRVEVAWSVILSLPSLPTLFTHPQLGELADPYTYQYWKIVLLFSFILISLCPNLTLNYPLSATQPWTHTKVDSVVTRNFYTLKHESLSWSRNVYVLNEKVSGPPPLSKSQLVTQAIALLYMTWRNVLRIFAADWKFCKLTQASLIRYS